MDTAGFSQWGGFLRKIHPDGFYELATSRANSGHLLKSAPNRYRNLVKGIKSNYESGPSNWAVWGFSGGQEIEDARSAALEMQKKDFPDKAQAADGVAVCPASFDVCLVWRIDKLSTGG